MSELGALPATEDAAVGGSAVATKGADWGGKAILVAMLAIAMAIPGLFVFGLVAERTHRAAAAVAEVSALQGGPQSILGPQLIAPYAQSDDKGVLRNSGWWVVSPDQGRADIRVRTTTLHRGIFEVPIYHANVDLSAQFAAPASPPDIPAGAQIDWSRAQIVMGFSDLRGARTDVVAHYSQTGATTPLAFSPAPAVDLGSLKASSSPQDAGNGFGLVTAPGGALAATRSGVVTAHMEFTGAARISVLPFAKSTTVSIGGDWPSPSFDGGFLPATRRVAAREFSAGWSVPFIARGLSEAGPSAIVSLAALGPKDLVVSFVRADNPYENVTRALKYGVLFIGLVFLTFFVFEALSGRRLHPAQYLMIGLAQMVFYLLLLSMAEYVGFDVAFVIAAIATVALIGLYAGAVFGSRNYGIRALVVFSGVYGLIYLLMRLDDFALLAGSVASFLGLATAMYLTRNIDWYGGRAAARIVSPAPKHDA